MAEQDKNKNLEALHEQLVKDRYAVPKDFKQFEYTFKDIKNARLLFEQLTEDKYAVPADFDSFATTFGLKKKDASDYGMPTGQVFQDMLKGVSEKYEVSEKPEEFKTPTEGVVSEQTPESTTPESPEEIQKKKGSYVGDLLERIGAGAIDIATSGPKQLKFAERIMDVPRDIVKKELSLLGIKEDKAEQISQYIPFLKPAVIGDAVKVSSNIWDKIEKTEPFQNLEKKAEELRESSARYDETISELVKNKEYKKAIGASFLSAAESFPLTVTAMFGGPVGLAAIGSYSAGAQYDEIASTDMTETSKIANALLNGGLEIATERLGTANYGGLIKSLYKEAGKEIAEDAVKKGLKSWFVNMFKKFGIYTAPVGEGIEEAVNQMGSNITARITGEDANRPLLANVFDAAASGVASGTVFTSVGAPAQIMQHKASKAEAQQKQAITDKGGVVTEVGELKVPDEVREQYEAEKKAEEVKTEVDEVGSVKKEPIVEETAKTPEETKADELKKKADVLKEEVKQEEVVETPEVKAEMETPKPEAPVVEKPVETPQQKSVRINDRLADLVKSYNSIPASYTRQRAEVMKTIQRLMNESDDAKYTLSSRGKSITILKDGKRLTRTAVRGESRKLKDIEDGEFKDFVNTVLKAKGYLYNLNAPLGPKTIDKAVDDLVAGKANQNTEFLLKALEDSFRTGEMQYKAEGAPPIPIRIKDIMEEASDKRLVDFDKQYGELTIDNLDKAVEMGIIKKSEVESFKKQLEDENRERERIESEWAEEESRSLTESDKVSDEVSEVQDRTKETGKKRIEKESTEISELKEILIDTAVEELGFTKEDHGEDYWANAEMYVDYLLRRTGMENNLDVGDPVIYLSSLREASGILDAIENKPSTSIESMSGKNISETINLLKKQLPKYKGEDRDVINFRIETLDMYGEFIQEVIDNKLKPNEQPFKQSDIAVGKEGGSAVPRGAKETPSGTKGEGAKKQYPPEQQTQIDAINKEYDEKIADAQKELKSMTEEARQKVIDKATKEIDKRNTLFGDADASEGDLIKPEDQGFEVSRKPIEEAVRKFDERKVELTKQIEALNKERESKIGEAERQQTMDFGEEPEKKPPTINKEQRATLDGFIERLHEKGGTYIGTEESTAGVIVKYKFKGDTSEREATIYKDGQMQSGVSGERVDETTTPLRQEAERILADEELGTTAKRKTIFQDLIHKSGDIEQLKSLLDMPYVKKDMELPKEINGRIRYLEMHPEKQEAPSKKITTTDDGVKYKDKTYTDIEQVLDDIADKKLTPEEALPLREEVNKFEDGLRKQADEASRNIDGGIEDITKKAEDEIKKQINDKKSKLHMKIFPDVLSIGNTALWKQLIKVRDKLSDSVASIMEKGVMSQNDGIRWASKAVTNLYQGLLRTQSDLHGLTVMEGGDLFEQPKASRKIGKLEMIGTAKAYAPYKGLNLLKSFHAMVNSDPASMERVWKVLDPELAYFTPDVDNLLTGEGAEKRLTYGDLSLSEKNLYWALKKWNTWIWSTNYANGLVPTASHLKFKGDFDATGHSDYIARMYDVFEDSPLQSPEVREFIRNGNSSVVTKRMITDYMNLREEIDAWKSTHAIKDPAYLTAKRVMQTIQNVAIKQYMDLMVETHPDFVKKLKKGEEVPKGYTLLSNSYSWGPLRGKAVINHIVEDFTGFHYSNQLLNIAYDGMKMLDRSALNQFYKKFRTVYNPFVQLGNKSGNVFFASINGLNPAEFIVELNKARTFHKKNPALFETLLKSGLLGDVGITGDMKALDPLNLKRNILQKASDWATEEYVGADNRAKIAAYQIYRRHGLTHQEAVRRAYDSFQNYTTVGKTWDFASKIPLIGPTFVKFQADLQRILTNNLLTSPLATIGTVMMIKLFGNLTSALSGETDEEQEMRESRKGMPRIPIVNIPLSFRVGDTEINVARYLTPLFIYPQGDSQMDVYDLSKFMPIQLQKPKSGSKIPLPAFADATWGWMGSVLTDRDFRNISIQNPYKTQYTDPNITTDERMLNVLHFVGRSQIPFYRTAEDIIDGITGQLDYYGRKRDWKQAILNNIIKVQEFGDTELKSYMERNIEYLTNRFASLSESMGDANTVFMREMKKAEDLELSDNAMQKLYEDEDRRRSKRMQKSLDEQMVVMDQLEKAVNFYKKLHPGDKFTEENFIDIEAGKNRRFNVQNDVDFQKQHPYEHKLLKEYGILKPPRDVPKSINDTELTEEQRKKYVSIYWTEYLRYLDYQIGLTKEEFVKNEEFVISETKNPSTGKVRKKTMIDSVSEQAYQYAKNVADSDIAFIIATQNK